MTLPHVFLLLTLAACGGGGSEPVVLGAPPPNGPPPPPPPSVANVLVGGLQLFGAEGGQAPHAVHVRAEVDAGGTRWSAGATYGIGDLLESPDGSVVYRCSSGHTGAPATEPGVGPAWNSMWVIHSRTGSGFWPEGRWQFQFTKADGSPLDAADRDWMRVWDPILSQSTYTDDRFSAAPTAAYMFRSPGNYKVRVRYQNRDKEWSAWVESSPIVVSPNTRSKLYVDGSVGSDAYDGLAALPGGGHGPKATLNAALALVDRDGYEIVLADDTTLDCTSSAEGLGDYRGVWIRRSHTGSTRPTVLLKQPGVAVTLGHDSLVEGLVFAPAGNALANCVSWSPRRENVGIVDCEFHGVQSFVESGSNKFPSGVLLLRNKQRARVSRYPLYIDGVTCLSLLGCDYTGGSDTEHTVRIGGISYVTIEHCILDYQGGSGRSKSALRVYARHVGVTSTLLAHGTVHVGQIDIETNTYRDFCFDGCKILFEAPVSVQYIPIFENAGRVVFRTCFVKKDMDFGNGLFSIEDNGGGGKMQFVGMRILNVTVQNTGTGNNSGIFGQWGLTQRASDIVVRGMLMYHSPDDVWSWGNRFWISSHQAPSNTPPGSFDGSWLFEDNVHSLPIAAEFQDVEGPLTLVEAEGKAWADGLIVEEHPLGADGEPLGEGTLWRTKVRSAVGVFRSINGLDWTVAGPAGAWYPPPSR